MPQGKSAEFCRKVNDTIGKIALLLKSGNLNTMQLNPKDRGGDCIERIKGGTKWTTSTEEC